MKRALLQLCFAGLCFGQQSNAGSQGAPHEWTVRAREQTIDGPMMHLRGDVEMRSSELLFRADAIDFDWDKAIVHLAGHARVETRDGTIEAGAVDYDLHSGKAVISPK